MSERVILRLDDIIERLYGWKYQSELGIDPTPYEDPIEDLLMYSGRCAVANGCFDVLHPGHLSVLATLDSEARKRRLRPVVALNSDSSVRRLKGDRRPLVPEEGRATLIAHALKWPMTVVIFNEDTPQTLMDLLRPKVVVKGSEYPPESVVRWKDSEVVGVEMIPRWSTTMIVGDTR